MTTTTLIIAAVLVVGLFVIIPRVDWTKECEDFRNVFRKRKEA